MLGACSSLGGGTKSLSTYDLTIPSVKPESKKQEAKRSSRVQILVVEPQALKALDSESIVVRPSLSSIEYVSGAQWGDRLPKIVQARLIQAYENSGRFSGVGRPGEGLAIDNQILSEIRAFEVRTNSGEIAVVEIFVKLLNDRSGVVMASKVFTNSVSAGSGTDSFVRALDAAFDLTAAEIVVWTNSKI